MTVTPLEFASLSIEIESYSPTFTVMRVVGDLDMSARTQLEDALREAVGADADFVIDLSAVPFMYSGAAMVILDYIEHAPMNVRVFAPHGVPRRVFEALGESHVLADAATAA